MYNHLLPFQILTASRPEPRILQHPTIQINLSLGTDHTLPPFSSNDPPRNSCSRKVTEPSKIKAHPQPPGKQN
jgi:hypothetical protein